MAGRKQRRRDDRPDPVVDRLTTPPTPIGDYGLLGDTRTAALVSDAGSIDWLCVPRFDGEPVFGKLVGGAEAGSFHVGPRGPTAVVHRSYRANSTTLVTTWAVGDQRLTLEEEMVAEVSGQLLPATLLVRRLSTSKGPVSAIVCFDPRLGEGHRSPRVRRRPGNLVCEWGSLAMSLASDPSLPDLTPGQAMPIVVSPEQPVTLVLAVANREPLIHVPPAMAMKIVARDEARWQAWVEAIDDDLPYRDAAVRSLITLRLLTYSPSGAPVAAPTTSLPEDPGGIRNWDYRFAWPRDASLGVVAFLGVGKVREARSFLGWLLHASRLYRPRLPALLTLDGRRVPRERELRGWVGYAGSRPVRAGNGAADQHQLDGYGWVLEAGWTLERGGHRLYSETWRTMAGFADLVADRWQEPDAGIWELRDDAVHHVHSKLMAWLALDRALRIGATHRLTARRSRRWQNAREAIAADIAAHGWDPIRKTYRRSYGSTELDAALLIAPHTGLDDVSSVRLRGTIDAIQEDLSAGPLLFRYPPGRDGLPGTEAAFLPCSFWMVTALAQTGRCAEATDLFDQLLGLATELGLYAEELDPATRVHLGNFPQALTHAALVQAVLSLRDAQRKK